MSFNVRLKTGQYAGAVTGFTGAAPQTVTSTQVPMQTVTTDSLVALVYAKATTSTLTLTGKWEGSYDGSTWYTLTGPTNTANVALVTGTGSAVTTTVGMSAPQSAYGFRYVRVKVTSGVGVGGGAGVDEASVAFSYVAPAFT